MNQPLLSRIQRDMSEGVLAIYSNGEIMYVNQAARDLLFRQDLAEGDRCTDIFLDDPQRINDDFLQCMLDAVGNKAETFKRRVSYTGSDGRKRFFSVASSFLYDEEKKSEDGVVLCFSDVTEEVLYEKKVRRAANLFVILISAFSLWSLFYFSLSYFHIVLSGAVLTQFENIGSIIADFLIVRRTGLTKEELGRSLRWDKNAFFTDALLTLGLLLILVLCKLTTRGPGPFLDVRRLDFSDIYYPLTVVFQEFLLRSVTYESILGILQGRQRNVKAVLVTAVFFGALHMHMGFAYMIGAGLYVALTGWIYDRQRTIWGVCIIHYVLFTAARLFGWL